MLFHPPQRLIYILGTVQNALRLQRIGVTLEQFMHKLSHMLPFIS